MKQALVCLFLISLISCKQAERIQEEEGFLFEEYFPIKNNDKKIYYVSHLTGKDTLIDKNDSIVCLSDTVMNKEIFYFTDEPGDSASIIGSRVFCDGVFYFENGEFFVSPVFWRIDLKKANLAYFDKLFPKRVMPDSIYRQEHGDQKRQYIFNKPENVPVKGKLLPACLKLTIIQNWPTQQYVDTVWFQRNTGVVKWLRSTGRLEEIKL